MIPCIGFSISTARIPSNGSTTRWPRPGVSGSRRMPWKPFPGPCSLLFHSFPLLFFIFRLFRSSSSFSTPFRSSSSFFVFPFSFSTGEGFIVWQCSRDCGSFRWTRITATTWTGGCWWTWPIPTMSCNGWLGSCRTRRMPAIKCISLVTFHQVFAGHKTFHGQFLPRTFAWLRFSFQSAVTAYECGARISTVSWPGNSMVTGTANTFHYITQSSPRNHSESIEEWSAMIKKNNIFNFQNFPKFFNFF